VNTGGNSLSDKGWQFAVESVVKQMPEPNWLCLIAVNAHDELRGQRFSKFLIEEAKQHAKRAGFGEVIVPLRPTKKHEFPLMTMEEYLQKKSVDGEIFNPWLRTHVNAGAEILNICSESAVVKASLKKWREWTGAGLGESGEHVLPGALAPLIVDLEKISAYIRNQMSG
jgi:hypothetical protein